MLHGACSSVCICVPFQFTLFSYFAMNDDFIWISRLNEINKSSEWVANIVFFFLIFLPLFNHKQNGRSGANGKKGKRQTRTSENVSYTKTRARTGNGAIFSTISCKSINDFRSVIIVIFLLLLYWKTQSQTNSDLIIIINTFFIYFHSERVQRKRIEEFNQN